MSEEIEEVKEVNIKKKKDKKKTISKSCSVDCIPRMMFEFVDTHTLVCEVCGEEVSEQDEGLIAQLLYQESFEEINSVSILMTKYTRVRGKELPPYCFGECKIQKTAKLADSIIEEVCKQRGISLDALKEIVDMKDKLEVEYDARIVECVGLDEDIKIKSKMLEALTSKVDELCKMLNIEG